jgi:hypothetical protein
MVCMVSHSLPPVSTWPDTNYVRLCVMLTEDSWDGREVQRRRVDISMWPLPMYYTRFWSSHGRWWMLIDKWETVIANKLAMDHWSLARVFSSFFDAPRYKSDETAKYTTTTPTHLFSLVVFLLSSLLFHMVGRHVRLFGTTCLYAGMMILNPLPFVLSTLRRTNTRHHFCLQRWCCTCQCFYDLTAYIHDWREQNGWMTWGWRCALVLDSTFLMTVLAHEWCVSVLTA